MKTIGIALRAAALSFAGLLSSTMAGCSGAPEDAAFEEDIAVIEEMLNSDVDTCGSATADKTYTSSFPSTTFVTPANYEDGNNGCGKAYFVDVTSYQSNGKLNRVSWQSTVPSTRASCEGASMRVYEFDITTGTPTFVGSGIRYGIWDGSTCKAPSLDLEEPGLPAPGRGRTIKFALSARSSNGTTKKLGLRSY
jgi:hypothetical protein